MYGMCAVRMKIALELTSAMFPSCSKRSQCVTMLLTVTDSAQVKNANGAKPVPLFIFVCTVYVVGEEENGDSVMETTS